MTELDALNKKVTAAKTLTEIVLKKRYGPNRTLAFLGVLDRRRLCNIFIWSERYHISEDALLSVLFNHYDQFRGAEKRKRNMGLPVQARTLMGKKSEEVVRQYLQDAYPDDEHIALDKQIEQQKQVNQKFDLEHLSRDTKLMRDCKSVDEYIKSYDQKMEKIFSQMATIRSYLSKHTRPYRGNPWR